MKIKRIPDSGVWSEPSDALLTALIEIVNEYDRMLGSVRFEVFVDASDYLDRLRAVSASILLTAAPLWSVTIDLKKRSVLTVSNTVVFYESRPGGNKKIENGGPARAAILGVQSSQDLRSTYFRTRSFER